jgi:uncharacterized protein YlzI (FlbEa/FlbD family)
MIKLTNTNEKFLNQPFLINPDHILTVFVAPMEDGKGLATFIYSETKESWMVKESIDEIYDLIKASK